MHATRALAFIVTFAFVLITYEFGGLGRSVHLSIMTRTIPQAIYRVVGLTGDGRTPPTLRCMIPLIFASRLLAFIGVAGIICVLLVRPLKTTGVVIFL